MQPINSVEWVEPDALHSNDYNPNTCFPPEMELLKVSIEEDGWTHPIVVGEDDEIIDGYHRWTLARAFPEILHEGCVPIVRVSGKSREERMLATIRHNRARGQHGILKMGEIVRELRSTLSDEEIEVRLGMESEEIERLSDTRGQPDLVGKDSFGAGWVPDVDARADEDVSEGVDEVAR